ncbi:MAG: hypothetical protein WCJ56_00715 [bacterium]
MRSISVYHLLLVILMVSTIIPAVAQQTPRRWDISLTGFFGNGTKPLYIYANERDGKWVAAMGSSRKNFNRSYEYVDMSQVAIKDGKVKGHAIVYLTSDLWIPTDFKPFSVPVDIDATVTADGKMDGTYTTGKINSKDESARSIGRGGKITGATKTYVPTVRPKEMTFNLNLQGALVGGLPTYGERCMVVKLGYADNKLISSSYGTLSKKDDIYGVGWFTLAENAVTYDGDTVSGTITIATKTLDLTPCTYTFIIDGHFVENNIIGAYKVSVAIDGVADPVIREGGFDGKVYEGVQRHDATADLPWWIPVKDFVPVQPGEHPRLLFRKTDVPALRERAKTPEGKAIIARLRFLLNGKDGESMPTILSHSRAAYDGGSNGLSDGCYNVSTAAGFGFLYQLTGEQKYADLAKEAFELGLKGIRDRDDRYGFRKPGGCLRAGPSLAPYALAYDLCYEAWDDATREKFCRSIAEYDEGKETKDAGEVMNLENLVRGTMPPGSNHFGMMVGGAATALLAVTGDKWVDQARIDKLLKISEASMVRNLSEGWGDGGFFEEGDGTGSMSSQEAFVTALNMWKVSKGMDFGTGPRPNARMMELKWVYQTLVRDGNLSVSPIRGGYPGQVWLREGMCGGGYFAQGLGLVNDDQRAAMKWFYNHLMAESDTRNGWPYDTATGYCQVVISSFVNWPFDLKERYPAEVLPLCYRDSRMDFYAWRNRWQDGNDIIITTLLRRTNGYMIAKPDTALKVRAYGRNFDWGTIQEGASRYWWTAPKGEISILTIGNGTCFAVDFTGASGAEGLLVTTGKADGKTLKIGDVDVTIKCLTGGPEPKAEIKDDTIVIGKQTISLKDGRLVLSVTEGNK